MRRWHFQSAFVLLSAASLEVSAQTGGDQTSGPLSLNLLTAPSSPAFVLLGVEPTSVERPGSITDVAVSLRSATDDFSVLPESYALSVAPWWLTSAADRLTYEQYRSGRDALLRTATISLGTATVTDAASGESTTSLGLGLRVALVQGEIDEDSAYVAGLASLRRALDSLTARLAVLHVALITSDPVLTELNEQFDATQDAADRARIQNLIEVRTQALTESADAELRRKYVDEIEEVRLRTAALPERRSGFNLDLAVGSVIDFLGGEFDRGDLRSLGTWLTGSLEYPWGAALGVARMQWEPALDVTNFDLGGRLILDHTDGLSLSAEGLARLFPNVDNRETEWRVAVLADYSIASNRLLSFSFGRDFDGRRSENLILGLNLALGFGATRPAR